MGFLSIKFWNNNKKAKYNLRKTNLEIFWANFNFNSIFKIHLKYWIYLVKIFVGKNNNKGSKSFLKKFVFSKNKK